MHHQEAALEAEALAKVHPQVAVLAKVHPQAAVGLIKAVQVALQVMDGLVVQAQQDVHLSLYQFQYHFFTTATTEAMDMEVFLYSKLYFS